MIDVRETPEFQFSAIEGAISIPMSEITSKVSDIPMDKKIVVICRSGYRSANVIAWLEQHYNYQHLYNLEGGMLAWAKEVDSKIKVM